MAISYLKQLKIEETGQPDPIQGQVRDPEDLYIFMRQLQDEAVQRVLVVLLDNQNLSLGNSVVSVGQAPATFMHDDRSWRRFLSPVIVFDAPRFLIITNHTTGSAEPDDDDQELIRELQSQTNRISTLVDYIVVGRGAYWALSIGETSLPATTWPL